MNGATFFLRWNGVFTAWHGGENAELTAANVRPKNGTCWRFDLVKVPDLTAECSYGIGYVKQ